VSSRWGRRPRARGLARERVAALARYSWRNQQLLLLTKNDPAAPSLYEGGKGKGAPQVAVRLPPDELAAIDGWIARQKEEMSRPVAIRALVKMALEEAKKRGR
jgi:hypothetical protein